MGLTLYFDLEAKQNEDIQTAPQNAVFLVPNTKISVNIIMKNDEIDVVTSIAEHAKIELSSIGKMLDKAELPPQVGSL